MPNQVAFALVPGNFPVCFFSILWQLSVSPPFSTAFFWHVATRKLQDATWQHHSGTHLGHHSLGQSLHTYQVLFCILWDCASGTEYMGTPGDGKAFPWISNLSFTGRWTSYTCHVRQNFSGYISLSEETVKIVLTIATALQIQQELALSVCPGEPSHPLF